MNENITATLTLTKDQWHALMGHIMNDVDLVRVALLPQIGKQSFLSIEKNANAILDEVKRATGLSYEPN